MKFLAVERSSIQTIIQDRNLQTIEFLQGERLSEFIAGNVPEDINIGKITCIHFKGGAYIVGSNPRSDSSLIFDFELSNPFNFESIYNRLLIFQKTLRLAVKLWDGYALGPSEHFVHGTKAVVFPFSYGSKSNFRVTVEKLKSDSQKDHYDHLLAYRFGTNEGGGAAETPLLGIFNLSRTGLPGAIEKITEVVTAQEVEASPFLDVLQLSENPPSHIPMTIPFENWEYFLTEKQKKFAFSELKGAKRLQGPAGTGKTLCLMLSAIYNLQQARKRGSDCHCIFITHSDATKKSIEEKLFILDKDKFFRNGRYDSPQSLELTTLQEWCGAQIGQRVKEIQFLDRDAQESKDLQLYYVSESINKCISEALPTHKSFMSDGFVKFLETENRWLVAEMFQHEIAVVVKGQAGESLNRYKDLEKLKYNLPIENESDKGFVFIVYTEYQKHLSSLGQFDTDDIVLTTISQLDTPIWRRQRGYEGYDLIFIDETHLFNINELSVLHFLSKEIESVPRIAFTIDLSQAIGDRGFENGYISAGKFIDNDVDMNSESLSSVFRSSPDIVSLAFYITSQGANLFSNFNNPLQVGSSTFTSNEEQKTEVPIYVEFETDDEMISEVYKKCEELSKSLNFGRFNIAIVPFSQELLAKIEAFARDGNRPVEILKKRGDIETINKAKSHSRFVVSLPEYIGGLEFDAVVIVGVDKGRVPQDSRAETTESSHFLKYRAINNLYVSITRAKFRVLLSGSKERGISELLDGAVSAKLIKVVSKSDL